MTFISNTDSRFIYSLSLFYLIDIIYSLSLFYLTTCYILKFLPSPIVSNMTHSSGSSLHFQQLFFQLLFLALLLVPMLQAVGFSKCCICSLLLFPFNLLCCGVFICAHKFIFSLMLVTSKHISLLLICPLNFTNLIRCVCYL